MADADIWRYQDACTFGTLGSSVGAGLSGGQQASIEARGSAPPLSVGAFNADGMGDDDMDDPRRCLRFDDFSGWSEGFRYPFMSRSVRVHGTRYTSSRDVHAEGDTLWNLVWAGDLRGVKRYIKAGRARAARAKAHQEKQGGVGIRDEPDPFRRLLKQHRLDMSARTQRQRALDQQLRHAPSPASATAGRGAGYRAFEDINAQSSDAFNDIALIAGYQRRKTAASFDINALGLVTEGFNGYERGRMRKHYGLFTVTYTAKFHNKLQLKRFAREACDGASEVGPASPLHWACARGDSSMIGLLIREGASQWVLAGCGAAPLHIACGNYHPEAVITLLTYAATTTRANICKCLAISHGNPYTVLHAGHWLQGSKMKEHFKVQADNVNEKESTLTDMSGKYGKMNLECFLHFEPFEVTGRTPIPLPPYRYRNPTTVADAEEMKARRKGAEQEAKEMCEEHSRRQSSSPAATPRGARRRRRSSMRPSPSRRGSMAPGSPSRRGSVVPHATMRRTASLAPQRTTSEKCTQTAPMSPAASIDNLSPRPRTASRHGLGHNSRRASMVSFGDGAAGSMTSRSPTSDPPSHARGQPARRQSVPFRFNINTFAGEGAENGEGVGDAFVPFTAEVTPPGTPGGVGDGEPRRPSALALMLASAPRRLRLESLTKIAAAMDTLRTTERLPMPVEGGAHAEGAGEVANGESTTSIAEGRQSLGEPSPRLTTTRSASDASSQPAGAPAAAAPAGAAEDEAAVAKCAGVGDPHSETERDPSSLRAAPPSDVALSFHMEDTPASPGPPVPGVEQAASGGEGRPLDTRGGGNGAGVGPNHHKHHLNDAVREQQVTATDASSATFHGDDTPLVDAAKPAPLAEADEQQQATDTSSISFRIEDTPMVAGLPRPLEAAGAGEDGGGGDGPMQGLMIPVSGIHGTATDTSSVTFRIEDTPASQGLRLPLQTGLSNDPRLRGAGDDVWETTDEPPVGGAGSMDTPVSCILLTAAGNESVEPRMDPAAGTDGAEPRALPDTPVSLVLVE